MSAFHETTRDLIDRGSKVVSGIADAAGIAANRAKIRVKIADLNLERDKLMKELGQMAYDELGLDPSYRNEHAALFTRIDDVIAHRQALEDELSRISPSKDDEADEDRATLVEGEADTVQADDEDAAKGEDS